MKTVNASSRLGYDSARHAATPVSYQSIAGGLLSEMARQIRSSESRKFGPPFKLVIIDNRGVVVFSCEVGRNGKVLRRSPHCKVRRSHFPANALITDGSFAVRTFRIERPVHRSY
jgi:hypothetical protein